MTQERMDNLLKLSSLISEEYKQSTGDRPRIYEEIIRYEAEDNFYMLEITDTELDFIKKQVDLCRLVELRLN